MTRIILHWLAWLIGLSQLIVFVVSAGNDSSCNDDQFRCRDGSCIRSSLKCDNFEDCSDGTDERDCLNACEPGWSMICSNNNYCSPSEGLCDGYSSCLDGSDERNCPGLRRKGNHVRCDPSTYRCKNNYCINMSLVCDGKPDCLDGTDESPLCGHDECKNASKALCDHICIDKKIGYECHCHSGYILDPRNNKTCTELDECMAGVSNCSQICTKNFGGVRRFQCSCNETYYELNNNNRTCRQKNNFLVVEPYLLVANRYTILNISIDGKSVTAASTGFKNVGAFDYDPHENMIYAADSYSREKVSNRPAIFRISMEDEDITPTIYDGGYQTTGIAVDWIGRKLYFLNSEVVPTLRVSELDGANCKALLFMGRLSKPSGIAVYPQIGYLYLTDTSLSPFIARIGMDGSNYTKILTNDLGLPYAITIDFFSNRIYWADAAFSEIGHMNLDGSNQQRFHATPKRVINSLTLFEDKLYWSDRNLGSVFSSDKFIPNDGHVLTKLSLIPTNIVLVHPLKQIQTPNPCGKNNGNCSNLCLISPGGKFKCDCPDYFVLQPDKKTCKANCSKQQFQCIGESKCISSSKRCDGEKDCADGSDETSGCPPRCKFAATSTCSNGDCISKRSVCDGENDCGDWSDESDCAGGFGVGSGLGFGLLGAGNARKAVKEEPCNPWEFKCGTPKLVRCIDTRLLCDGFDDCHDKSDETEEMCKSLNRTCSTEQFKCNNGKCIEASLKCDTMDKCGDKSDEPESCREQACPRGWSPCENSYACVPDWVFCNGYPDCNDRSDENPDRCPKCDPITEFACNNKKCIPKSLMCDTENSCEDNSDEFPATCNFTTRSCAIGEFACADKSKCIPYENICNGVNTAVDCKDLSDETDCKNKDCPRGKVQCANGLCIDYWHWCDRERDCTDGSDETDCANVERRNCTQFEFACKNGVCITKHFLCNFINDCGDSSDETDDRCLLNTTECNAPFASFKCRFSGLCISAYLLCDGKNDCGPNDYSDEASNLCYSENQDQESTDIKECKTNNDTCSQTCANRNGSYECVCAENFIDPIFKSKLLLGPVPKQPYDFLNGRDCRAKGAPPMILVGKNGTIQLHAINSLKNQIHGTIPFNNQPDSDSVISLDYHPFRNVIYWIESKTGDLWWATSTIPDKSANATKLNIQKPTGRRDEHVLVALTVDWMGDNVYVIETMKKEGRIFVTKWNGKYTKTVVTGNLMEPSDIIVNPARGMLFWSSAGDHPKIESSHMNGQNRKIIVEHSIAKPTSLTIDYYKNGRLYWTDSNLNVIDSILPDGTNRKLIASVEKPIKLDIFENWIYFVQKNSSRVYAQNKFGGQGNNIAVLGDLNGGDINAIRISHTYKQQYDKSQADNTSSPVGKCSHFRLVGGPNGNFECACPDGMEFEKNSKTRCH